MRKTIITLTACLLLLKSLAQQPPPNGQPLNFSLADCINYAYEHQDSIKNARLDVNSADYKIREIKGQGLPQVNGSVSFQDFLKSPVSLAPAGLFAGSPDFTAPLVALPFGALKYNNTYALQANQLLFSGSFLVGLKAAKTYKELSERNLSRTRIQTNVAVTKAYYQVLVSNEQIKLLDANINQLNQQLQQTTQQNKQGFVEKIDVDRLSVQYNNLVTNRENVTRALTLGYAMLKFQMGMPIQQTLVLTDKLENVDLTRQALETSVDTTFYHNRIEYNLLETASKLNQLDLKLKKAAYLPSVVANAGLASVFQENRLKYLYQNSYANSYIGLGISLPIYDGGQRSSQVKQSQVNVQKSQNDLENARNGLSLQAEAARITLLNSLQSLNNQKSNQQLANEVLRVARIKYAQGVGSSIEVTQAQTALETSNNDYIQALYDALINKVNLDQAYGRIK